MLVPDDTHKHTQNAVFTWDNSTWETSTNNTTQMHGQLGIARRSVILCVHIDIGLSTPRIYGVLGAVLSRTP